MRKKVLHIINSLMVGGAEMLLVNSLSEGGLQQYNENIIVYFQGTSDLEQKIDKQVKVYNLGYKGLLSLPRCLLKLRKIISHHNVDIIHSHLNPAGLYAHIACPGNIPQVHTLHIAYTNDLETSPLKIFFEKYLYFNKRNCNLIFLSEFTKNDFMSAVKFKGTSFILNNFIDDAFFSHPPKKFTGSGKKTLKLIAVGNVRPQKNYFYLLEIFKHLKAYDIEVDIYGEGDIYKYQKVITENDLKVTLKGQAADINAVIADYDLFIMTSINEGFPLSVFEAMAAGVPLMLSNIAPLQNIVKDNAIYFELDNAQQAARQLIDILEHKTDIDPMAIKAKAAAEKTAQREIYINKLQEIYHQILA